VGTAPHVGDRLNLLPGELGDRLLGAGVVDDVLAISGGGDECGGGGAAVRRGPVLLAGQPADDEAAPFCRPNPGLSASAIR
jgi:hypothetical protein